VDGYRAVAAPLAARPGARVLVMGGASSGSIGLYAAAITVSLGSKDVLYVDEDPARRQIAEQLGARTLEQIPEELDRSFAVAVDARGDVAALELAIRSLARDGVCTATAIYFTDARMPALPLLALYAKGTTFTTGRIHARRDLPQVLELLGSGVLDPVPVTTRTVAFDEAADALLEGGYTKLLFVP
jgi:alcohol dehydrogenase